MKKGGEIMGLEKRIYSVLIISAAEKFNTALAALLPESKYSPVRTVSSISSAKHTCDFFSGMVKEFCIHRSRTHGSHINTASFEFSAKCHGQAVNV